MDTPRLPESGTTPLSPKEALAGGPARRTGWGTPRLPARALARLGRRELALVLALCGAAGLLYAFAKIASEVLDGETAAFDRRLLLALRNPADLADPIGPLWVEIMMKDITSLGSTTVLTLVTLAGIGYLAMTRKRAAALLMAAAVGGGALLSHLLKIGFARPRPDLVAHVVDVHTASFPSGHAMLSAVTYLTIGALLARMEPNLRAKAYVLGLATALTVAVGLSRVYLGVHYPTDVLAGWSLGAAWSILCWLVMSILQHRGRVERGGLPSS